MKKKINEAQIKAIVRESLKKALTEDYMNNPVENNDPYSSLCEFMDNLGCLTNSFSELVSAEDISGISDANELYSTLEDQNAFDEDVIYYSKAINYLAEHDPSLHTSLNLAAEQGYEAADLSSEILASILASNVNRETFQDNADEINDYLEQINNGEPSYDENEEDSI